MRPQDCTPTPYLSDALWRVHMHKPKDHRKKKIVFFAFL